MAPKGDDGGNMVEYLIAGGTAGIVSRTVIAPIERVKILFQISKAGTCTSTTQYWRYVPQIYKEEGVIAFWKGNTAAVVRVVPYMAITFLSYEEYKVGLRRLGLTSPNGVNMAAGSLAGLTAVAATYPLDLVRARLAKQQAGLKSPKYRNMLDALIKIPLEQGRVTGDRKLRLGALYRGMGATMVGEAPYSGLKFCFYEGFKRTCARFWGIEEEDLSPLTRVTCGAVSGLMAVNLVYPFDVVRRRMQTYEGGGRLYPSPFHAIAQIAREEGIRRGLYRGLTLNYLKTVPNVAIYMSLYDMVKRYLIARDRP